MPRINFLFRIGIYGVVSYAVWRVHLAYKIKGKLVETDHFKRSVELLKGYPAAIDILGEPIMANTVNMADRYTMVDNLNVSLSIPVSGPKGKGILYTQCSKKSIPDDWVIDKLDFQRNDIKRKWTFYVNPDIDATSEAQS